MKEYEDLEYVFGAAFEVIQCLRGLFITNKPKLCDEARFENINMVGAPFQKWTPYRIKLVGTASDGSEEYYLGASKDEKGRIWHRFVLSTLESDLHLGWPLFLTNVCEDSYKIKDKAVHIEGHNWTGLQIPLDSMEGKDILLGWMANRKKESCRKAI